MGAVHVGHGGDQLAVRHFALEFTHAGQRGAQWFFNEHVQTILDGLPGQQNVQVCGRANHDRVRS